MRPRRKKGVTRGRGRGKPRKTPAINLDGASSSEDESKPCGVINNEEPSSVRNQRKVKQESIGIHITLSPDKMSRGIMSESSDSDDESHHRTTTPSPSKVPCMVKTSVSDSSDDIFNINYKVHNHLALRGAYKELNVNENKQNQNLLFYCSDSSDNDDCRIEEDLIIPKKKQESDDILECPPSSPTLFEIDKITPREEESYVTKSGGRRRTRKQNSQQELPKKKRLSHDRAYLNDTLNLSSDVIISEDEEDVNPEMRVLIKWNSESFRLPVRKFQKFSHLYEVLAEKYKVAVDRVVLSLHDKIINPELCRADLNLTIVDIIEGGIMSLQNYSHGQATAPQAVTQDPDSISLRVQCSNKKGFVIINIGLKDKMSILMHKYAEERRLKFDKLRFILDGERLCANSTPSILDLEGGECIDVYELT